MSVTNGAKLAAFGFYLNSKGKFNELKLFTVRYCCSSMNNGFVRVWEFMFNKNSFGIRLAFNGASFGFWIISFKSSMEDDLSNHTSALSFGTITGARLLILW